VVDFSTVHTTLKRLEENGFAHSKIIKNYAKKLSENCVPKLVATQSLFFYQHLGPGAGYDL
jgi:hypothetical protein